MEINKQYVFTKEVIAAYSKVSSEYLESIDIMAGLDADDVIEDLITVMVRGKILSNFREQRMLTYYCPRPTFFDWLLRRRRVAKWEFIVKDILLDPPKLAPGTNRLYIVNEVEE